MRLDNLIIGLLIFSFVVVSGTLLIGNAVSEYGITDTTGDFGSVYNSINTTYSIAEDVKGKVLENDIESGSDAWESMATGSYGAIRLVSNTFSTIHGVLKSIVSNIGIPSFVITFAITAIIISILFAIIYLIFRVK